ncbi:MAG: hypothetical protein ACR2PG_00380 [Hyphomicrobiaceae bacterium]
MSIDAQVPTELAEFWSASYRGQDIAVQRHYRGWLVYLNKVMQQGILFASAQDAANWLRRKIDEENPAIN